MRVRENCWAWAAGTGFKRADCPSLLPAIRPARLPARRSSATRFANTSRTTDVAGGVIARSAGGSIAPVRRSAGTAISAPLAGRPSDAAALQVVLEKPTPAERQRGKRLLDLLRDLWIQVPRRVAEYFVGGERLGGDDVEDGRSLVSARFPVAGGEPTLRSRRRWRTPRRSHRSSSVAGRVADGNGARRPTISTDNRVFCAPSGREAAHVL
jgi:hypothetical protein